MALDVYVGPLTLYYAGQWENVAQAAARERGFQYHIISTRGEDDAVKDPAKILPMIADWRASLSDALGENILEPLGWDESYEDYMTGRPGWGGYGALILWAAYVEHPDLARPPRYVEHWEDLAYKRSTAADATNLFPHVIRSIEFWLPAAFGFTFKANAPNDDIVTFGSTATLWANLQALNDMTWQADRATIERWGEYAPAGDAALEDLAKYGFSEMFFLAEYACQHRLPMKLDY
ncbi:MAG: hypothetical protein WCK95_21410 [Alphaproteobacteria bacterium]|jgi:hypothetical protein